jgi:23S rRNA pseudouridine2605 synthase
MAENRKKPTFNKNKNAGTNKRTPTKFSVEKPYKKRSFSKSKAAKGNKTDENTATETREGVRLNKFLANAGVCSRREADVMIAAGLVTINGKIVTELGLKVLPTDIVKYGGETLRKEKHVYVLLNKPKGYITTSKDPNNRKTVMHLVESICKERIYPVGRLDRETTGVLLFTNDGELAKKLTHPKYGVRKIYHVQLHKNVTIKDMQSLLTGVELEDGSVTVDSISYVGNGEDKKQVGVELHSGKYRVIRRVFEKLGYTVMKLDRVSFAGLTKKNLTRGRCRILTESEVNILKRLG